MAINGVGDVIALVQITAQAAKTLHDATHAPDEVKRFILEIDRYQSCVESAATRLRRHGALLKSRNDVKRNIQGVLEQCADTTRKLRKIATRYQHIVKKKGVASAKDAAWYQWMEAFRTVYHSIEWTTKVDIVDRLRAELSRNIQMLTWLEGGLVSDQIDQLVLQMSKIQDILVASTISSPSRTPLTSPIGPSPNPPPLITMSPSTLIGSPDSLPSTSPPAVMTPLRLSEPMLDPNDWHFDHNIDPQLGFPENFSFPGVTPGDEYRHVKLATANEQDAFIRQLTYQKEFTEIPVASVSFVWRKPGSSDSVVVEASDPGRLLLIRNGAAVEDIWTLNDKKTIRFRQRVPTWDDIIPYSINGDEKCAVVEQGEGLTFFTIEKGERQDHPRISTTWVTYNFKNSSDCENFQQLLYGWKLRLLVPIKEICRPHRGRDDDRLAGYENVRVWERETETRFMAHLIQEKGKKRKKYLEFDLCQDTIKVESKGTGRKSTLLLNGINAMIDDPELERRGSSVSLSSATTIASGKSSLSRRFSWDRSTPFLDKVEIHFDAQEYRDSLLHLTLGCRSPTLSGMKKGG